MEGTDLSKFMTLLEEIQTAAVDVSTDLGTLLRKCKVLGARLGSVQLENWVLWESNGYPENVPVPDYRVWTLQLKGDFSGPFRSTARLPIPLIAVPEKARKLYENYECRESVAAIEATLKTGPTSLTVSTGDLALAIHTDLYNDHNCVQAWAEFGPGHLIELLNVVRNRILRRKTVTSARRN
jgi:AbiTii-like protein